ncbi:MAG TPA: phosphatidate cytidylyltransferase [Anaerolineales bacterium]|nr:phosphatidate cytidylyltransferase [Anaerolineales bacterium]
MESFHRQVLFVYAGFAMLATMLALARRWIKPNGNPSDVWKKYPIYVLLNFAFLAAIWLPHTWHALSLLLAVIGCCASWELSRALGLTALEHIGLPVATAGLILVAEWLEPTSFIKIWLVIMLAAIAASGLAGRHESLGRRVVGIAGCLGYLPLCLAAFIWIWQADTGDFGAVFLYGVIATNDAFAQITGQLVGRRMLAPDISPGKTLEGAGGGLLFAAVFGASLCSTVGWSYVHGALIGAAVALAGLTGDLTVSGWKRALGLKDFSNLLGAHGGVLDRFDALIFAAPIFFLLSGR